MTVLLDTSSKDPLHSLSTFNICHFDDCVFQTGLNIANVKCQVVKIYKGYYIITYFYHLAPEIRKIEAVVEKARVHNRKGTFEALSTWVQKFLYYCRINIQQCKPAWLINHIYLKKNLDRKKDKSN